MPSSLYCFSDIGASTDLSDSDDDDSTRFNTITTISVSSAIVIIHIVDPCLPNKSLNI